MDGALLSDEDLGLYYSSPPSTPATGAASAPDDLPALTVHRQGWAPTPVPPVDTAPAVGPVASVPIENSVPGSAPEPAASAIPASTSASSSVSLAAPAAEKLLTDEDLGLSYPKDPGVLTNAPGDGYFSGALKGLGTAAVKAVGNTIGFAGGLHNLTSYLVARGAHAITGQPVDAIMADMAAKQAAFDKNNPFHAIDPMRLVPAPDDISGPILKQTGQYQPTSEIGKLAQTGAETVLSSLGPGAGAAGGTASQVLTGAVKMAPATFAAGAAAQGATDATGDPLLGLVAGAVTPVATHLGESAAGKVTGPAFAGAGNTLGKLPVVGPSLQNAATRMTENAASRGFIANASDPDAVKSGLIAFDPSAAPEVPGTMPTTAGLTRDPGLLQAEMTARGPGGGNVDFNQRDAVQNSARIAALQSIQPEGDVFRPGQYVTERLQAVDAAAQRAQEQLKAAHAQAVAARAQGTQVATDRLAQSFQAAHDQLLQNAQDAAAPLSNLPAAEQTGAVLRTAQQEATKAKAEIHGSLFDAVDPEGTLTASTSSLKAAKVAIAGAIDPHAGVEPSGAEAKLWTDIDRLPDAIPFKSLQKLDSRVTAAMTDAKRNPNPEDPEAHGRLVELKTATMSAIDSSVENQAAHEARLVQAGVIAPVDTLKARLLEKLRATRDAQDAVRSASVASGGGSPPDAASGGAAASSGDARTEVPGGRGPGSASSDQGLSPAARSGPQQPEVTAGLSYQAPALGDRTVSAQMHAPETAAALGQDVPGTVVRPFSGPLDPRTNPPQGIVAYHGSPHDFDSFDLSKIGTGEGNQAYGHGLYFAENENVSRAYRGQLTEKPYSMIDGKRLEDAKLSPAERAALTYARDRGVSVANDADMRELIDYASGRNSPYGGGGMAPQHVAGLESLLDRDRSMVRPQGSLYQVRLNRDPDHFLDWDKPAHAQSPYVMERLRQLGARDLVDTDPVTKTLEALGGDARWKGKWDEDRTWMHLRQLFPKASDDILQSIADRVQQSVMTGAPVRMNSDVPLGRMLGQAQMLGPEGAANLKGVGLAGVRYLDEGSRGPGRGTQNYVAFNDRDIQVTHKNGVPLVRPVALPDMLKGEARAAFVPELLDAGLTPASFSTDLKTRAEKLLNSGERVDHGRALEQAAISADPKEVQDAIFGGSTQGRGSNAQRDGGAAGDFGLRATKLSGQGSRSRQPRETGRAPVENLQSADTPEAAGRLRQAKDAYIEFKQIHDNPIVRGALETNGFNGQYLTPDSAIPSKWIVKGDKGADVASAFLRASGGDPRAIAAMKDAVLAPLRKGVLSNGTLHPRVVERWKSPDEYGPALRAIDSVSPGFAASYDNAARATQTLMDAGLEQKRQLDDFQRQAAAQALSENAASKAAMNAGLADIKAQTKAADSSAPGRFAKAAGNAVAPTEVENVVGGMLQTKTGGASRMREMVQSLKAEPDALAGFQKAGVDWMVRAHLGATEAASSGEKQIKGASLISFLANNRDVLKELYPTSQVSMFGAVARSIETDARWIAATTAKNGPGTAKDLAPRFSEATKATAQHTSMAVVAMEGLREGFDRGGWTGAGIAAAAPAAYLVNMLRQAGIRKSDALYQRMLLDPEFARLLISKMPENLEGSKWHALTRALRLQLIMGAPTVDAASHRQRLAG